MLAATLLSVAAEAQPLRYYMLLALSISAISYALLSNRRKNAENGAAGNAQVRNGRVAVRRWQSAENAQACRPAPQCRRRQAAQQQQKPQAAFARRWRRWQNGNGAGRKNGAQRHAEPR